MHGVEEAVALPGAPRVRRLSEESGASAIVPLPSNWIDAIEAGPVVTAVDRRIWLALLAHSWPLDPSAPVYSMPAARLREAVGMRARSNTRLRDSLSRLAGLRLEGVSPDRQGVPVFTGLDLPGGGTRVAWGFDPGAVALGLGSRAWMRVDMSVMRDLSGPRAARLYWLLGLRANLRGRFWSVPAGDLRRLLAPDYGWERWGVFRKSVLAPAVANVERATGWRVQVTTASNPTTRHVIRVRFTMN